MIDRKTLEGYPNSRFYHNNGMPRGQTDSQYQTYVQDLERAFSRLPSATRELIEKEVAEQHDWDSVRIFAAGELRKNLQKIDLQDSETTAQTLKEQLNSCLAIYNLLAAAPVANFFNDGKLDATKIRGFYEGTFKTFVKDKNLFDLILQSFSEKDDLAILERLSDKVYWGDTENVRDALILRVDASPDRVFRSNIHRFQDWLVVLDEARNSMKKLQDEVAQSSILDLASLTEFDRELRGTYDLGVISSRFTSAMLFDLPMETLFASSFARVSREAKDNEKGWIFKDVSAKGKQNIVQSAREIGPFFSISQRLCVLRRTNTLRTELDKLWKKALGEGDYTTMESYLATDSDLMRDASRLEEFFREWR